MSRVLPEMCIAQGGIDRKCTPTSTCAYCGREGLWQPCKGCRVVYYCSASCRDSHLKEHEDMCGVVTAKRLFVEQSVHSVRQLVQEGNVVRITYSGDIVESVGRYEHPSPLLNAYDSMVAPVLKVGVKASSASKPMIQINASFSLFAIVSVISTRLAKKLGLQYNKRDVVDIVSPREWKREAYLPADCLSVQCIKEVVSSTTKSDTAYLNRPSLQVAPVICPTLTVDLLLGRDWFQHFGEKANVIYGPGDNSSKIRCASGLHISLPWGRLDCNPAYCRTTSYMDHIILMSADDLTRLDDIRGYVHISTLAPYAYQGDVLDPVMCHHNISHVAPPLSVSDVKGEFAENLKDDLSEMSVETNMEQPPQPYHPWVAYLTDDGCVYYYNNDTGESSWEMY